MWRVKQLLPEEMSVVLKEQYEAWRRTADEVGIVRD